ncbi:MAG: tRNA preQ1(34) S-adenosylmethionine ribosyltransferase-isomerase QueA [Candidatus Eisenbacteria bacterium]|nr:tRNA preQ1(34) S-adenosylmethionine ribosyltransferase-isomerase QueA [Candidatus Eisenbacteria bacterium]
MHISDFDYELPPNQIAQHPLVNRDESRLLVVPRGDAPFEHKKFGDLSDLLDPKDLLIVNNTRVRHARLDAKREGFDGHIEILLLKPRGAPHVWEALTRPARKLDIGTVVTFAEDTIRARVTSTGEDGLRVLEFDPVVDVPLLMREHGHVPLPPYISRADQPEDTERYQTVFAAREGAVAAPTAGLHFSEALLAKLADRGIQRAAVTLHVGIGTFRPVMAEDPRQHKMESEWYDVPEATALAWRQCRERGGRVVAVGTTVVRTLESATITDQCGQARLESGAGWADLFIYEPFNFRAVDALVTNFHLPRSTLLMLVSAFAGLERTRRAYRAAIRQGYRFYSYGDSSLYY